jgi:hypothetical protein
MRMLDTADPRKDPTTGAPRPGRRRPGLPPWLSVPALCWVLVFATVGQPEHALPFALATFLDVPTPEPLSGKDEDESEAGKLAAAPVPARRASPKGKRPDAPAAPARMTLPAFLVWFPPQVPSSLRRCATPHHGAGAYLRC